jgi:hypothetical protein
LPALQENKKTVKAGWALVVHACYPAEMRRSGGLRFKASLGNKSEILSQKYPTHSQALMAHTHLLTTQKLDREDPGSRPAWENSSSDPSPK